MSAGEGDEADELDHIVRTPEEDMSRWLGRVLSSVALVACGAGVMLPDAQAQGQGRRNAGAQVFSSNCSGCHGADGRGAERGHAVVLVAQPVDQCPAVEDDL